MVHRGHSLGLRVIWLALVLLAIRLAAAGASVSTVIGTGSPGYSDREVNNPYGVVIGPDGALYFCDLDNQRIRRLDLQTRHIRLVAGNGQKGVAGGEAHRIRVVN